MKGLYPDGMPLTAEEARDDLRERRRRAFEAHPHAAIFLGRLGEALTQHRVDYNKSKGKR